MTFDDWVKETLKIEPCVITHISPEEQKQKNLSVSVADLIKLWNRGVENGLSQLTEKDKRYFVHTCGWDFVIDEINADVTFSGTKKECEQFVQFVLIAEKNKHIEQLQFRCESIKDSDTMQMVELQKKLEKKDKQIEELKRYNKYQRCSDCEGLHRQNGNCLIVGGFYTAVADKDCPKIKEKLELANRIKELEAQIEKMKSDVISNRNYAIQVKDEQMEMKMNSMLNQWERDFGN